MAGKKRISASEEEVGKLHKNGIKMLNVYTDAVLKKVQDCDDLDEIAFLVSINDVKKIMDIVHNEGFYAIDASEDKTSELSKEIERATENTGKVLSFLDEHDKRTG